MISRFQKILFFVLLAASVAMAGILLHLRNRAHKQLLEGQDSAPTEAPDVAPMVQATLMVASDSDGSLRTQARAFPLPGDEGARAHALLGRLFDLYAAQDSSHPVPGGASGVAQVFLLAVPGSQPAQDGPQLAVVNLTGAFANGHPSGIETEMLTIQSICSTLHANLPRIAQVRFLVDGQTRPTLAGHADLTRTYLTQDAAAAGGATE